MDADRREQRADGVGAEVFQPRYFFSVTAFEQNTYL